MKKMIGLCMTAALIGLLSSGAALASEWVQENDGRWWYRLDDGTYPSNSWYTIDGKYYYFDASGYMMANTTTPDGYQVGADGAWIDADNSTAAYDAQFAEQTSLGSMYYYKPANWNESAGNTSTSRTYFKNDTSLMLNVQIQDMISGFSSDTYQFLYKYVMLSMADNSTDKFSDYSALTIGGQNSGKGRLKGLKGIEEYDNVIYMTIYGGKVYVIVVGEKGGLSSDSLQFADRFASKVTFGTASQTAGSASASSGGTASTNTIIADSNKVYNITNRESGSESSETGSSYSSSKSSATGYEAIYNKYKKKLQNCNGDIYELAEIYDAGVNEMAKYLMMHTSTSSSYYSWAKKLGKVYVNEGGDTYGISNLSDYMDW